MTAPTEAKIKLARALVNRNNNSGVKSPQSVLDTANTPLASEKALESKDQIVVTTLSAPENQEVQPVQPEVKLTWFERVDKKLRARLEEILNKGK